VARFLSESKGYQTRIAAWPSPTATLRTPPYRARMVAINDATERSHPVTKGPGDRLVALSDLSSGNHRLFEKCDVRCCSRFIGERRTSELFMLIER
jgi:hypothetical protein